MTNTAYTIEDTLPSFPHQETEVVKRIGPDGKITYHHPQTHSELRVFQDDLNDMWSGIEDMFSTIADLIDVGNNAPTYHRILDALIRKAETVFYDTINCIDQNVGHIELDCVSAGSWPYRCGRVLDARLVDPPPLYKQIALKNREQKNGVIKRISPDGKVTYHCSKTGTPVYGYHTHLETVWLEAMNTFSTLASLLPDDDDTPRYNRVIEALTSEAERRIQETAHFIGQKVGDIKMVIIGPESPGFRPGRIIDLVFTPIPKKEQSAAAA